MRDEVKFDRAWDLLEAGDTRTAHNLFVEMFEQGDLYALMGLAEINKNTDFAAVQRLVNIARDYTEEPHLVASMIFHYIVPEVWNRTAEAMQRLGNGETSIEFPDFDSTVAARAQVVQEMGELLSKFNQMGGLMDTKDARKYLEFILSEGKLLYTFSLVLAKPILRSARMLLESSSYQVRDRAHTSIKLFFEHIATPERIGAMYLINNLQDELATFEDELEFFREIALGLEELEPLVDSVQDLVTMDIACDEAINNEDRVSVFVYRKIIGVFIEDNLQDSRSYEVERLKAKYLDAPE